jgi:hypothetical protein
VNEFIGDEADARHQVRADIAVIGDHVIGLRAGQHCRQRVLALDRRRCRNVGIGNVEQVVDVTGDERQRQDHHSSTAPDETFDMSRHGVLS